MPLQANQVRIIGGRWRGRKIVFPDVDGLRPTPDRVRETVFNWLGHAVYESRCLDLFAGSGALGFEALSRGASHVTFVDNSLRVTQYLHATAPSFDASHIKIIQQDGLSALSGLSEPYDIVFLDPPFHKNLLMPCILYLSNHPLLKSSSLIYSECEPELLPLTPPTHWLCKKSKCTGNVAYTLFACQNEKVE